jgi:hypothetical protein
MTRAPKGTDNEQTLNVHKLQKEHHFTAAAPEVSWPRNQRKKTKIYILKSGKKEKQIELATHPPKKRSVSHTQASVHDGLSGVREID